MLRAADAAGMADFLAISCDGCTFFFPANQMTYPRMHGHVVRYCADCAKVFEGLMTAITMEERRLSALHDLFIEDARKRVPLKLTPYDLPAVDWGDERTGPMRLG